MAKVTRNGFVDKKGKQVSLTPVYPGAKAGNFATFKSNGTLQDSRKKASDFAPANHKHDDDYAPKVHDHEGVYAPATHEHSQYLTSHQDISGKADKVANGTENNFAALDANGNLKDSGNKAGDFAPATHEHSQYLTSHQDISGKADKVVNGTENNFAALDANGNLIDSGKKAGDFLTEHQNISGKADKVANATENNFAALDANGNLKDSTKKASDFLTSHQDISGKADKVANGTENNFAALDANGNLKDSGKKAGDFLTSHQDISGKADKVPTATENHLAVFDASGGIKDGGYVAGAFSLANHYHSDHLFQCKKLDINCTDGQTSKILTDPADGSGISNLKTILIYIDLINSTHNISLIDYKIPIIANFKFLPAGTSVDRQAPAILEAMKNGTSINIYIYFGTGTRLYISGSISNILSYWQDAVFESNTYSRLSMTDGVIN